MQWTKAQTLTLLGVLAAAAAGGAAPGDAQVASRPNERVLFLVPSPLQAGDTIFAIQLADHVRQRMDVKMRHRLHVIPTDQVCELLTQSGYRCSAILGPVDAARLARAMQADAYIHGLLDRSGAVPIATYRLVDLGRSGLSGWQTVRGTAGDPPRRFAETIVDSLDTQVRAAEVARECFTRRDRGDYRNALDRAQRAFQLYPDHPSAATCAAVVLEAQQAPLDSQIRLYQRAVRGDSLHERAWERLSRLYLQQGDSLQSLAASRQLLGINPGDRERWRGVIAGYITVREYMTGRDLADEWLNDHPDDLEFLQLKARACTEGELWRCALDALSAQYALDSSLVGDTIFYGRLIGAAQELGESGEILRWSSEAARRAANPVPWIRVHSAVLQDSLQRARDKQSVLEAELTQIRRTAQQQQRDLSAEEQQRVQEAEARLAALRPTLTGVADTLTALFERLLRGDSTDVATTLGLARLLMEGLVIDTATPLDTTRLFRAERLLDRAVVMSPNDTAVLMNAAVQYYTPAAAMAQKQLLPPVTIRLLEKALRHDVLQRLQTNANFFLGFALFFELYALDRRVVEAESCTMVAEEAALARRGLEAMQQGASLAPQQSQAILREYTNFVQSRIPDLRRAFCQ